MSLFQNEAAEISFFVLLGCLIFIILAFLWMHFCYYPGGYKRSEVIDIGELAVYNARRAAQVRSAARSSKEQPESDLDNLYFYGPSDGGAAAAAAAGRGESGRAKQAEGAADWAAASSNEDVEGGAGVEKRKGEESSTIKKVEK